jgi:hypothetical protein
MIDELERFGRKRSMPIRGTLLEGLKENHEKTVMITGVPAET